MMASPTVAVVIVTRNDLPRLAPTITDALLRLAGLPVEIVVVDGASTDGTVDFLEGIRSGNLRYVSEPDSGIYDAMNKASRIARAQYLYFLNSGDRLGEQSAWAAIIEVLESDHPSWLVAQVEHRGSAPPTLVPPSEVFSRGRLWLGRQSYNHQGTIFRTDLFTALGGYDLTYGFSADLHLILKFSVTSQPPVVGVTIAVYEGGGISAPLVRKTPRVLHRARCELLGLGGLLRSLDAAYSFAQTAHRLGLLDALRLWKDDSYSFSNPWFPRTDGVRARVG